MDLSPRQKNILDFIRKFVQENGYPPTIREIGRAANISSTSVVNYNLNILQAKGYIQRDREISRGVKLVGRSTLEQELVFDQDIVRVPVLGRIVASEPVPIPDETFSPLDVDESIALTRDIVQEQGPIYALQVKGDSMIDALIYDGDIVIMKAQKEAQNGDLVAAWLKTEKETTLKRFYWESKNRVRLQPANPNLDPIYVHPANLEIQGKVIAVIRQV
nr:transcriptional repressor LexA [Chloroflexota bacterium]